MKRTFANNTGSPEIRARRESPVIGGARFYPGTSMSFTEAQWESLPQESRNYLMAQVALGNFSMSTEMPPEIKAHPPEVKERVIAGPEGAKSVRDAENEASAAVEEPTVEETEEEQSTEEQSAEEQQVEETPAEETPVEETLAEEEPAQEESEDEKSAEETVQPSTEEPAVEAEKSAEETVEEPKPEVDKFDYDEFLIPSIAKIKESYLAMAEADRPNIETLIAKEKAGANRRGLVEWLTELLN